MTIRVPRRVLIAPSGFKESLSAESVAAAIGAGVRRALPGVRVDLVPVPDGGEGTAATLVSATGGRLNPVTVTGPVGEPVTAHWGRLGGAVSSIAIVEMASAAGLSLVPRNRRDPGATTTHGVGQLVAAALDDGVDTIIVGCGDSGTCDGGAGALEALGARILDAAGEPLGGHGGSRLVRAARLDLSRLHPRARDTTVVVAGNPHNVLCGPAGVARVFGPQKGATPEQVSQLDAALDTWADVLMRARGPGPDLRTASVGGASGGLGAGLAGGLGARLSSRFDALLDSGLCGIDLDRRIGKADLAITAEGSIDFQTPRGKVPAEIARRCAERGVPVLAIAGSLGRGAPAVHDVGIAAIASIIPVPMPLEQAVAEAERLLTDAAERTMRMVLLGGAVSARAKRSRRTTHTNRPVVGRATPPLPVDTPH
ncbi:glycerate kinase [Rhodococcus rhodnii]|uniref:Glycerate kinase n=2 Tax=Rhodococcus rhodnii TaxID=38312 RepID=R7WHF4_9NOCA|nr:glycerate kinase [Rhodococcus rhodnii]EOM74590.1 glycerate kinase [Rhodococcus rhodnii LMG 5362]TXG89434.1 glycerate kinase [Rhodococcus rhodnii]